MGNINVHIDEPYMEKFRDLKRILKCQTNEETVRKLIIITQKHLEQNLFKSSKPQLKNQSKPS